MDNLYKTRDRYEIIWLLHYGQEPVDTVKLDLGKKFPVYEFYFDRETSSQLLAEYYLSREKEIIDKASKLSEIGKAYYSKFHQ